MERKRTDNQRASRRRGATARPDMSEARLEKLLGDAHASGLFAGMDHPLFNVRTRTSPPISCMITVYRLCGGKRRRYTAVAYFNEFNDGSPAWRSRPHHELARCAQILALTYGFTGRAYDEFEEDDDAGAARG